MISTTDFPQIFLTKEEIGILTRASDGKVIFAHPVTVKDLLDYGFLSQYTLSNSNKEYVITPLGIKYYEYYSQAILHNQSEEKHLRLVEVRSWIALIISLLAFLWSIFSKFLVQK